MATVSKWNPYGVALDITATAGTVKRISATQYTVVINASWKVYYSGNKTNYGMKAASGGVTKVISSFGTNRSSGSAQFTGTYFISGGQSQNKTITVTFTNYEEDWQGNVTKSSSKNVSFTVTVPAWTTYTISYNANGGSGAPSSQTKYHGTDLVLSSTKPTRTGYTFKGWALTKANADAGTWYYQPGYTCGKNENLTLYAVWEINTYTVSYNGNGGTGVPANQTKTYGVNLTLSSTVPTRANETIEGKVIKYVFKGWSTSSTATEPNYNAGSVFSLNQNTTLYAVWETDLSSNIYITYNCNGSEIRISSQVKQKGVAITLSTKIPFMDGYTFAGWATALDGRGVEYQPGDTYNVDKDLILYAIWTPWAHTVVFNLNGGTGNIPASFSKLSNEEVVIPEIKPTKQGAKFRCWSTTSTGVSGTNYNPGDGYNYIQDGGTVTLYAIWDEVKISIYKNKKCQAREFVEIDETEPNPYFKNDASVCVYEIVEGEVLNFTKSKFYVKEIIEK